MQLRNTRGFTIIELLAVVAVVGVVVSVVLPAIRRWRGRARSMQCLNNLKQLGIALHAYEQQNRVYPPSFVRQEDGNPPPPPIAFAGLRYRSHWTGFHMLLPFISQQVLFDEYNFNGTWLSSLSNANDHSSWPLNQSPIATLICPSAVHEREGVIGGDGMVPTPHWMAGSPSDYAFSHGADAIRAIPGDETGCTTGVLGFWAIWPKHTRGMFGYSSDCRPIHIRDGLTNSIMLGEKCGSRLTYSGWNTTLPTLPVEYPWAMAAPEYFAATGDQSTPNSYWVVAPFAVTADIQLPNCPEAPLTAATPFPMNPFPTRVPPSSDERPFYSYQSMHRDGANFLFADGSARFLQQSINQSIFEALSTIAGGEALPMESNGP